MLDEVDIGNQLSFIVVNMPTKNKCGFFDTAQLATSSSAIAEEPRDALSQLKSCQLLHNCTKNHI